MIEEMTTYHTMTIQMLLVALIFNLLTSQFSQEPFSKFVRMGYFLFWALISMVVFAGIVLFFSASSSWDMRISVMVLGVIAIGMMEFKRVQSNAKLWLEGIPIKRNSALLILTEIIMVAMINIWASM
ncbi:MAG: hypothetical protein JXQ68_01070 [Campylobacterales bacterium]|nr:hypothetical protein [Campylobacterales bacterium]